MTPSTTESQYQKRPFSLGIRWQERVARENGGVWQKTLTQKERGQLKMLANALGSRTHEVMDWAVANWTDFTWKAMDVAGLRASPCQPHIGFLLAHCDVAVNRMQAIAEAKKREDERLKGQLQAQAACAAKKEEEASALAANNEEAIKDMLARFAAAGEPLPEIEYNKLGEVLYHVTKKEIAELMASLS